MLRTLLIIACCFFVQPNLPAQARADLDRFLFGASVYPELQTREEWNKMLDLFQKAHFNVVRVGESSWGNLEVAPGEYNFGWLRDFLDDLAKRGMKAILGTSTYIPPQWLTARNPDVLVQLAPGLKVHPMARKAACLNHPLYREACQRYIRAIGKEFKDHPAVIGWQLDNEIEFLVERVCYNPACERAWREWLKRTYGSPEKLNERLHLVSWGMKVSSFEEVPQPAETIEGIRRLPALTLANLRFRRDVIMSFLIEQAQILREVGVRQWITTDWNTVWTALADDPLAEKALDVAGLNFYQPSADKPDFWKTLAWHHDMHRSAHGLNHFLVMETRIGVAGGTWMNDPFPTHEQFRMWMLQPVAFGATALLYWTGNRWHGGHWPHWGGLLDWSGKPEPDFEWVIKIGEFFKRWGDRLVRNPVKASAVVLTDFDQRAALQVYPHTPASLSLLPESFDALHRLGIGVDSINSKGAENHGNLSRYLLVVIPAATVLDGTTVTKALRQYVEKGGHVLITPFAAYQSWDGIFRNDGFGANLYELTGVLVRTARRMGTSADSGRKDQHVVWSGGGMKGVSPIGVDGYCELMEVSPETEIIARFQSDEAILNGKPAATKRSLGKGSVIKLGFWPKDDSIMRLIQHLVSDPHNPLALPLPPGVQAVPRTDNSMFIINTSSQPTTIQLIRSVSDRISGGKLSGKAKIESYGVLWLE